MAAGPKKPPGAWRQMWLRIRYAEYVGTRFTRGVFRSQLPAVLLNFGSAAMLGVFLSAAIKDGNAPLALLCGGLFLLLFLFAVTGLRMLIGYCRTDRYPVIVDLWSDTGLETGYQAERSPAKRAVSWSEPAYETARRPFFNRIGDAFSTAFMWFCAAFIWLVAIALFAALISGDLVPGGRAVG